MKLVIVESPTKARKLNGFLGGDFRVESSVGHIVDLPKSGLNVDLEHGFTPKYEIMPDKKKVVANLQALAKKADLIYLASDPDREGEAIAWHLQNVLNGNLAAKGQPTKKNDLDDKFVRATFHEITKEAVLEAIAHPNEVKIDLVNAQQARRILDRIVGYQVSPILWKKVRRGLSAGRVQSVALRLIVEREKEIIAFIPEEFWEVSVVLDQEQKNQPWTATTEKLKELLAKNDLPAGLILANLIKANGKKYEPKQENEVVPVVADLKTADYEIEKIEKKERKTSSYPPFTTSTLQQAAANRLGMTSKQTMTIAQQLYEEGLITYHRTDSFNLAPKAITMARDYIEQNFGREYLPVKGRIFAKKSKNAQEAHEAIRVTDVKIREIAPGSMAKFSTGHAKLYDLIWRRFVASQMSEALFDQTMILIKATKGEHIYELKTTGSTKKFAGWTKLFPSSEDRILPTLAEKEKLYFSQELAEQKFTQPPARYNDASIVKKLEELGIGRPSTYASIISVIIDRGYVERQQKKFFATPIGITVSDFLWQNLSQFIEYDFTAQMEEELDEIARGEKEWTRVLSDFYGPFAKKIAQVTETAERAKVPVEETGEACPLCGATEGGKIVIRTGKFGKFKSCSRFPECKYTQNMQEIVEGVKCPLCQKGDVVLKPSRWGKNFYGCSDYPECKWASWSKPEPGQTITMAEWEKMQAEREEKKRLREEKYGKKTFGKRKKTAKVKATKTTKTTKTKIAVKEKKETTKITKTKPKAKKNG